VEETFLSSEQWAAADISSLLKVKAGRCARWWDPGSFRLSINTNPNLVEPRTSNPTAIAHAENFSAP